MWFAFFVLWGPWFWILVSVACLLLLWMTYWPWSMIWTIINDPIRRAFRAIYSKISGLFEMITNSIYDDAEESDRRETP